MRVGKIVAAVFGAGMLIAATPVAANAANAAGTATGGFSYRYIDAAGSAQQGLLMDPPSQECVTLPQVADPDTSAPADSPLNFTDAAAIVFTGPGCRGDSFRLQPFTGHGSERLKLRSVLFV
ncbi:hypothetical protein ABH926_002658 [Catenulispora sp. GP43]|uniref:hypothetical protein n=1 Tax=Catenulispora sp. GP43 TaxID=3156263 RepID=UPI0035130D07